MLVKNNTKIFDRKRQTRRLEPKRAEQTDYLETVIHNLEIWKCDMITCCKYDGSKIDLEACKKEIFMWHKKMFYSVPLVVEMNNTMTLSGLVSYRILMFNYKPQAHF